MAIANYFRILNVDLRELARDRQTHRDDFTNVSPDDTEERDNEAYTLKFFANGFAKRIQKARKRGTKASHGSCRGTASS